MKEVEVKIRIDDPNEIMGKLQKNGFKKSGDTLKQDDDIFLKKGTDLTMAVPGTNVLRIRTINDSQYKFTVKQRTERMSASIEYESLVENKEKINNAIRLLGYYNVVSLSKMRQKYKKDNITVCIDNVDGLGNFMEVEKMVSIDTDSKKLQDELMQFAVDNFGITESDKVNSTYDIMMYEKLSKQKNKKVENYAFIDGQNLYRGLKRMNTSMDYKAFRIYLKDNFNITKTIVFMGYLQKYEKIYLYYKNCGFDLFFKEVAVGSNGEPKGNVDAEIVVEAALNKFNDYKRAVIVSSDGDYAYLVKSLKKRDKFLAVISPEEEKCSRLLKKAVGGRVTYLENILEKLRVNAVSSS